MVGWGDLGQFEIAFGGNMKGKKEHACDYWLKAKKGKLIYYNPQEGGRISSVMLRTLVLCNVHMA